MIDILNLALPYFGLIFIGFACGKYRGLPESGLAWMNFYVLYVSLPALFFRIVSKTPFEELNNLPFVVATTLATAGAFTLSVVVARLVGRLPLRQAAMAGLAGGYGNIGYMGPGLALAVFGLKSAVPTALIFCFDSIFLFTVVPVLMALTDGARRPLLPTLWFVAKEIALHPLIVAVYCGVAAAALRIQMPVAVDGVLQFLQNSAAPVALFVLGVTVALRPFGRVPWELRGLVAIKLVVHPVLAFGLIWWLGPFTPEWAATAVLMASLPPALNVFVIARQYDTWTEAASAAVMLGTLASVVTLTTAMWLLKSGYLAF
ncbi:MAG: AEC family transporter [Xanthobacteraceae bacterium]|nr:AEC family transporter [Xanthobacteraceae bacterium]